VAGLKGGSMPYKSFVASTGARWKGDMGFERKKTAAWLELLVGLFIHVALHVGTLCIVVATTIISQIVDTHSL